MKLVVGAFVTLDGVVQAPGGPEEDRSGGFEHGGWLFPYVDDDALARTVEWCTRADALLLGRKTYEIFAAYWPHVTDPANVIATTFNRAPKHVASRTLTQLNWHNSTLLPGDVAQAIAELKCQPGGELQVHGSGHLVQTLLRHNLIDELRLWIAPLMLGTGKRLFDTGTVPVALQLVESQTVSTGATLHVYRPVGKPDYGSFAQEEPSPEEIARRQRIGG